MNPVAFLARFGVRRAGRVAAAVGLVFLVSSAGLLALVSSNSGWLPGLSSPVRAAVVADDTDHDGLPDALENRIGSNPTRADTLGMGVPDGWVYTWEGDAVDWNDTTFLRRSALVPPPDALPEPLRVPGALQLPTLASLYAEEKALRDPEGQRGAWWLVERGVDPRGWSSRADGIADAWLLQHGVDPLAVQADAPAPGDPSMTLRDKYLHGLDPSRPDSDGDGLFDLEEITGKLSTEHPWPTGTGHPSDPLLASSRGDGVGDGFVVRFGLDPADPKVASRAPVPGGLTVAEAQAATLAHCARTGGACDWATLLKGRAVVDPTTWSTLGDGVADAWAFRDPNGIADPLVDASTQVVQTTASWDAHPWSGSGDLAGVHVDGANPLPRVPFSVTVRDLYRFGRPAAWDERVDGPWWGGLPTRIVAPAGALPLAVALRGWNITVDRSLGPPSPQGPVTVHVLADPRKADGDGDGLSDLQEYQGVGLAGGALRRTDPSDADSDGDGLPDGAEVATYGTDPTRADTSGGFLTDGQKVDYWTNRSAQAVLDFAKDPVLAAQDYRWLDPVDHDPASHLDRLGPLGVLGGGLPNVRNPDSDGDGLRDGQELYPNRFLQADASLARPATDPARTDSDGDALPDAWEVAWSTKAAYNCASGCGRFGSENVVAGWPLNPALRQSLKGNGVTGTDGQDDLKGEVLVDGGVQEFSNALAYKYGLGPYPGDSNQDGLPDFFSLYWGVQNIPQWAVSNALADPALQWSVQAAGALSKDLGTRGFTDVLHAIAIDPARPLSQVTPSSSLLGLFGGAEKGAWTYALPNQCGAGTVTQLPSTGPRADSRGLPATPDGHCWTWQPYPLSQDVALGTNPWVQDTGHDGLPDAWKRAYKQPGATIDPLAPTPGSLDAGCLQHVGAPNPPVGASATYYCITYAEAYKAGLDPNSKDSDGGGILDWMELKVLKQNPLNSLDDFGTEDWDGDGIPNAMESIIGTYLLSPDSDHDGLLDGDLHGARYAMQPYPGDATLGFLAEGHGKGNLCLPPTGPAANMANRPGGPLSNAALAASLVAAGVLFETNAQECPSGNLMFKREGVKVKEDNEVLGAADTADSLLFSTGGDGVPDGWKVYWRDRAGNAAIFDAPLNPRTNLATLAASSAPEADPDPDGDQASTLAEYGLALPGAAPPGRAPPADWKNDRDGVWWGGTDPTKDTTCGCSAWFTDPLKAQDSAVQDVGGRGVPDRYAYQPDFDRAFAGLVHWDPANGGSYRTDYANLWPALDARPAGSTKDIDVDQVPDFLDRARVAVSGVTVTDPLGNPLPSPSLSTGDVVSVGGTVRLSEADSGAAYTDLTQDAASAATGPVPVAGATVKVLARDVGTAREALVGVGFTAADGSFQVKAAIADPLPAVTAPAGGASVAGRWVGGGTTLALHGADALQLAAGPIELRVEVEANPPAQPVQFGGLATAVAYKDEPFVLPDGLAQGSGASLKAVALDPSTHLPKPDLAHVRHTTNAIFGASSAPVALHLKAKTSFTLDPAVPVLLGAPLGLGGRLLDAAAQPVVNRVLKVEVFRGDAKLLELSPPPTTDTQGHFAVTLDSIPLGAGPLSIRVNADLHDDDLNNPSTGTVSTAVLEKTHWDAVRLPPSCDPCADGSRVVVDARPATPFAGRLVNHLGQPVRGQAVTVSLARADGELAVPKVQSATDADGVLQGTLAPLPPGLSPGLLFLKVQQVGQEGDTSTPFGLTLDPRYPTRLTVQDGSGFAGGRVSLAGRLVREGGAPVAGDWVRILAVPASGDPQLVEGTDGDGRFVFHAPANSPGTLAWTLTFAGAAAQFLAPSASVEASAVAVANTTLRLAPLTAQLRGQAVSIRGTLQDARDIPSPGLGDALVRVGWGDADPLQVKTAPDGSFNVTLPPRAEPGRYPVLASFGGDTRHVASSAQDNATVLLPTVIQLSVHEVRYAANGLTPAVALGRLLDDRGTPLAGRPVTLNLTTSGQATRLALQTDAAGAFGLPAGLRLVPPGAWAAQASYGGSVLEAASSKAAALQVVHELQVVLARAPRVADPSRSTVLAGRLDGTEGLGPFRLVVRVAGVAVALASVQSGPEWTLSFRAPLLANGTYPLTVSATGPNGTTVAPAGAELELTAALSALLEERTMPDGTRHVSLRLQSAQQVDVPLAGLVAVLVREDARGFNETRSVTLDASGAASLDFDATPGPIRLLALRDSGVTLADVEQRMTQAGATIKDVNPPVPLWVWITAGGLFAAGAAAVAAALLWRRRQRQALRDGFLEGRRLLLDPRATPAQAIQAIYAHLLACLSQSGFRLLPQQTARDIAQLAVSDLRLPAPPMRALTGLFERARYSTAGLTVAQRDEARAAVETVLARLGGTT